MNLEARISTDWSLPHWAIGGCPGGPVSQKKHIRSRVEVHAAPLSDLMCLREDFVRYIWDSVYHYAICMAQIRTKATGEMVPSAKRKGFAAVCDMSI